MFVPGRILLFFCFAAISFLANADAYYWRNMYGAGSFSSPLEACRSTHAAAVIGIKMLSPLSASCLTNGGTLGTVFRAGDSCPQGFTFNDLTGVCEAPPKNECEEKEGQPHTVFTKYPDMQVCVDKCLVAIDPDSTSASRSFKSDVSSNTYYILPGKFTGAACTAPSPPAPPDTPPTSSEEDEGCGPTTVEYDAEGRRHEVSSCTRSKTEHDNQKCVSEGGSVGSVNGVMTCIKAGKGPTAKNTTTTTESKTTTNPDGSKDQQTTKTTETKTCSGVGSCGTTTTTTVNNSKTNADGSSGGSSSSCTGSNCTGSGSGSGSGSGIGGEGSGEDGEGEEPGEGPAGPGSSLQRGQQGSFSEGLSEWDQRVSDAQEEMDLLLDQYSVLFQGVFDLNLSEGSGSLPCDSASLKQGAVVELCISDFAGPLSWFRYGLLLGAALLAAYIVLRD